MATELRPTGVDVVGDMAWGTHFCAFYDTRADLLETLVSYFRAGLQGGEFCLWVVAPPLTEEDAAQALRRAMPDLDHYLSRGAIEIVAAREWYLGTGSFDQERVIAGWHEKLASATARGFAGARVTGDTAWLKQHDWKAWCEYEGALNGSIADSRIAALCTYPLGACGADEILDVVGTHQFAVTKRHEGWEVIETAGYKQAKAEIRRLMEDLERRVEERTRQLSMVNAQLVAEALERQRAEDALRRSDAYLTEAQRLTHTGSWAFDIAGRRMLHSSREHSRLYGFDPDRGLPSYEEFLDRVHPDDRPRVIECLERAGVTATDVELYFQIVRPDGTTRRLRMVGHPVRSSSGSAADFLGISMDVTDQWRAERERETLRQAQADLAHVTRVSTMGELTASLAHEIKQPITAAVLDAQTCLRWIGRDEPDMAQARDAALRVVSDVTRASDIINRIRQLFKQGAPERELLDVNEVIQGMVGLLRSEASRCSVAIRPELAAGLPPILADRVQLQQVLMNLMINGIEAMQDMGTAGVLTVRSSRGDAGQLVVAVSDTGVGVRPQDAEQLFQAFFTTKPQGIGMGLSISRSIIESHGGSLWASANTGRGTTFQFTLPIDGAPRDDDAATATRAHASPP